MNAEGWLHGPVDNIGHPDWVALQTRQAGLEGTGEIRLRELVKQSLRMRPSRIMGGQIRGCESSARPLSPPGETPLDNARRWVARDLGSARPWRR